MPDATATTPEDYIDALPDGRREAVRAIADVVRRNLPAGFEEGMSYGMIAWYVPLERFPDTYNGQPLGLAALASQKRHMALYLNNVYGDAATEARFRAAYAASGKNLDMGKSCVRFRRLEDLPLDVIGEAIRGETVEGFIARYAEARGSSRKIRATPGA